MSGRPNNRRQLTPLPAAPDAVRSAVRPPETEESSHGLDATLPCPLPPPHAFRVRFPIRKEHDCGKVCGASKSCFIASPTALDLEPTLELMSEKLMKPGIEPVVAVRERAYGQDIFCTKICGKIIEARFCIVILDDDVSSGRNVPNPNVYYEYGLMTSLRKHVIPLQKAHQDLAFNIQSHDTIKYAPGNLATELERAIRDAIRLTATDSELRDPTRLRQRLILRKLELAGFVAKEHNWFLSSVVEDTLFSGFGNDAMGAYLYLGKVDNDEDARTYLEDLAVVLIRTEKKAAELQERIETTVQTLQEAESQVAGPRGYLGYQLEQDRHELPTMKSKLHTMETFYIGFIIEPDLPLGDFRSKVEEALSNYRRYRAVFSSGQTLQIGQAVVDLSASGY